MEGKAWKTGFAFCHSFVRAWARLGGTGLPVPMREREKSQNLVSINKTILYTPWNRFILQFR